MAKADSDPRSGILDAAPDDVAKDSSDRTSNLPAAAGADPGGLDVPRGDVPSGDVSQTAKVAAEDDLHAALTSVSPEVLSNIDSTLDQLTSAADLFEVSAFDLDA
jgi:hypothetical protein